MGISHFIRCIITVGCTHELLRFHAFPAGIVIFHICSRLVRPRPDHLERILGISQLCNCKGHNTRYIPIFTGCRPFHRRRASKYAHNIDRIILRRILRRKENALFAERRSRRRLFVLRCRFHRRTAYRNKIGRFQSTLRKFARNKRDIFIILRFICSDGITHRIFA